LIFGVGDILVLCTEEEKKKDTENNKITVGKGKGGKTCIRRDGCGESSEIL